MAKKSSSAALPVVDEAAPASAPEVDAGVIIAAETPTPYVVKLEIDLIDESPTNPRKDMGDLAELAESIRKAGVLQPVTVRVKGERFELVFGHRRLRAAKLAGLTSIPAQVRELGDQQVLELQLVENAQRRDISPLEEADAYRRLHAEFGMSADAIAQRTGKSKASVYARMKLGDLRDEKARAAFADGTINASVALLLARLEPKDQAKAIVEILKGDNTAELEGPMSYRQALDFLREEFTLNFARASFDPEDASLVARAGSCETCPKRINVDGVTLTGKVDPDDLCDDRKCWDEKVEANRAKKLAAKVKNGFRPLSASENAKIIDEWNGDIRPRALKLARLSDRIDYDFTGNYQQGPQWEQALDAAAKKLNLPQDDKTLRACYVAALDGSGHAHELVDTAGAWKLIKKAGVVKSRKEGNVGERDYTTPRTKQLTPYRTAVDKANAALTTALLDAIRDKMRASPELDAKLLRLCIADHLGWRTKTTIKRYELPDPGYGQRDYFPILGKVKANDLRAIGAEVVLERRLEETAHDDRFVNLRGTERLPKPYLEIAEIFGVDVKKLEADAARALEAELAAQKSKKAGSGSGEKSANVEKKPVAEVLSERAAAAGKKPTKKAKADPFKKIANAGRKAVKKITAAAKPKAKK